MKFLWNNILKQGSMWTSCALPEHRKFTTWISVKKMRRKNKDSNGLQPSNGWIAFSQDEEHLIAYGATYDEVVANAERQGVADLIVVKVPETRIYRVRKR